MMTVFEQRTHEAVQELNRKIPELKLRDLFAIQAMNGLLACGKEWDMQEIAELSYRQADAMLEARGK